MMGEHLAREPAARREFCALGRTTAPHAVRVHAGLTSRDSARRALTLALVPFALACHLDGGTQPHDMGAAAHAQQAERETARAEEHTDRGREAIARTSNGCDTHVDRGRFGPVCWTSELASAKDHARAAERHGRVAEQHRAASVALRDAESRACVDIDDENRDTSPFAHRRDVRSAQALSASLPNKTTAFPSRVVGAQFVFGAVPGMTAEWLQRVVDCHVARNAAIGHARASEDMPYCPLTLAGVHASVSSAGDGFAITVTADDPATAKEILRRARLLVSRVGP